MEEHFAASEIDISRCCEICRKLWRYEKKEQKHKNAKIYVKIQDGKNHRRERNPLYEEKITMNITFNIYSNAI